MASVDALDFAIYRYLSPDGAARFWGSRRVIDPRVTARELADRVGVSEAGVRVRLKGLREKGFLVGSEVWPNPSLFGVSLQYVEIPIRDVRESRELLRDLELVEGVTFARDVLDEEDRKVRVYSIVDTPAAGARRIQLLQRLAGGRGLRGPTSYYVPPSSRTMTRLDWRVARAFRDAPDASLVEVARRVGISLKTLGRRFHELLDGRAIWWTPSRECAELPLALLTVELKPRSRPEELAGQVAKEVIGWIPVASDGSGTPPDDPLTGFAGLLWSESPAAVEGAVRRLIDLPGVTAVRRTFALSFGVYPGWFDDQIGRRLS